MKRLAALLWLALLGVGSLHGDEIWTESSYLAKEIPSARILPTAQSDWEFYSEAKVVKTASFIRVEQRLGKNPTVVTWVIEKHAATEEPGGSVVISSKEDFDIPAKPTLAGIENLKPVAEFTAAGNRIQVFDKLDRGGTPIRLWIAQDSQSILAQSVGRLVSVYTGQIGGPTQFQLPESVRASIKELKRKRQKAANVGAMPQ